MKNEILLKNCATIMPSSVLPTLRLGCYFDPLRNNSLKNERGHVTDMCAILLALVKLNIFRKRLTPKANTSFQKNVHDIQHFFAIVPLATY